MARSMSSRRTIRDLSDDALDKWRQAVLDLIARYPEIGTHHAQTQNNVLYMIEKEVQRRASERRGKDPTAEDR